MSSLDSFFKNEERRMETKSRQEIQNKNIEVKSSIKVNSRKSLLIQGKIMVLCPKLGEEVSARQY